MTRTGSERTEADMMRDAHMKLMRNLDRCHSNMHQQLPAPVSISYESMAMDLKDAMDAALEISTLLKLKGL